MLTIQHFKQYGILKIVIWAMIPERSPGSTSLSNGESKINEGDLCCASIMKNALTTITILIL